MSKLTKYKLQTRHEEIDIYIKDNKAKETVLFIHGFDSDYEFAAPLYELKNNFNIVSFSFPKTNMYFQKYLDIVEDIQDKVLKGKNFTYFGHSLGGAINMSLKDSKHLKRRILLSPLNPSVVDGGPFKLLYKIRKPKGLLQKVAWSTVISTGKILSKKFRDSNLATQLTNPNSEYNDVIMNNIANPEWLRGELLQNYLTKPATYIIGEDDTVIPAGLFIDFVRNTLDSEVLVSPVSGHSPITDNTEFMHRTINDIIPFKRRFIFSRFVTKKALTESADDITSSEELKFQEA